MLHFQIDMRRRLMRLWIFTGCVLATLTSVIGQASADSIILSAMKHELNRNMRNLVKDGYDKPFFISYTIADIRTAYANGTLGALTNSGENHYKDWNARVMVGDYELNDENFVSNDVQSSVNRITHQMPIDNDYLGIRLALWSVTDNIYNSAATQYKRKKTLIEDEKVQEDLLGISDFSKAEVVKKIKPYEQVKLDKSMLENKVRLLSKTFANYPEIYNSNVSARQFYTNIYFINSEGTEVIYPAQFSVLTISVNTLTERNENISRSLVYNSLSIDGFPDNDLILSDIQYIIEDIELCATMEPFSDDYSGPIIYTGDIAANVFLSKLFSSYGNNLKSSRKPLTRKDQMGTYYDDRSTAKQWKIGKKIFKDDITITEYSKLKSFNGIPLWGAFEVDGEGVTPPDSILLIENGFVKNKLNGRTPSKEVDSTNGHMRLKYGYGGIDKAIGPGIVKVHSSNTSSYSELKKKMLSIAKEEGLEYGIVVKKMPVHATVAPLKIFKIMVETGEEIPLHSARLGTLDDKVFKDIAGVSDSLIVYNTFYSGGITDLSGAGGTGGMPVSVITPSALLFEEVEIEPVRIRYSNMKPIVESPLK
jgi:hypothetical protein